MMSLVFLSSGGGLFLIHSDSYTLSHLRLTKQLSYHYLTTIVYSSAYVYGTAEIYLTVEKHRISG